MKVVTGDTIWSKFNPIPNQYTYLSEDTTCDVLIVGAGVTGALCSYYFAKENINTILVDKNIIGYDSTRANTAILQYEIDQDLSNLKRTIGDDAAVNCFKETANGVKEIEFIMKDLDDICGFIVKDCFYYTDKNSQFDDIKKEFEERKKAGFKVKFMDSEDAKEKFSFKVKGGIYSEKLAAEIDPYRFSHSLIKYAVANGVRMFENTEIIDINNGGDDVVVTSNKDIKITAKKIIIATGYEARDAFKKKIVHMTRTFNIVTKPLSSLQGWYNMCIIRDMASPYTYIRSTPDKRMIIGGEDEKLNSWHSKMYSLSQENPQSQKKYEKLLETAKSLFKEIDNIEIEYGYSGFFGETKDGLPYIGEHEDYKNFYFCLAYGSNGIINAAIGARMIKDLYLGNKPPLLDLFALDR